MADQNHVPSHLGHSESKMNQFQAYLSISNCWVPAYDIREPLLRPHRISCESITLASAMGFTETYKIITQFELVITGSVQAAWGWMYSRLVLCAVPPEIGIL